MNKYCKKALMGIAALLILFGHFYIVSFNNAFELTFYKCAYIGVDIFFMLSGISLVQRKEFSVGSFYKNRLIHVYIPFVVLAIICCIYKRWSVLKLILVITTVEFFQKGGGAFLWFIPGIIIIYLLYPLIRKVGVQAAFFAWLVIMIVLQYGVGYTEIFILLNRFPIFLLGLYYPEIKRYVLNTEIPYKSMIGIVLGGYFLYHYGGIYRTDFLFIESFYYFAVPFVVSLVTLIDAIFEKYQLKGHVLGFIGAASLETYGLQMIFGYDIETVLLKNTNSKLLSFILTCVILIILAFVFRMAKEFLIKLARRKTT